MNAPENQYPIAGRDYMIQCEVQADPPPIISWERGGVAITSKDRYVVDTKGLLIKGIKESDDGVYTCRAVVLLTGHLQNKNIKVGSFNILLTMSVNNDFSCSKIIVHFSKDVICRRIIINLNILRKLKKLKMYINLRKITKQLLKH